MKLKDSVTKEQLEELGFVLDHSDGSYCFDYITDDEYNNNGNAWLVVEKNKEISISLYNKYSCCFVNDVMLKMFKLGYIEESEKQINENK